MKIEEQIAKLRPDLDSLHETYQEQIASLQKKIHILVEISSNFTNNWVGEWASHTYNYYRDIISENGNNVALEEESIQDFIEKKSGVTIKEIEERVYEIAPIFRNFQVKLVTELSVIIGMENLGPEIDLLKKIETHTWGITPWDYVKMRSPKNVFTYNPASLLNKGLDTPPHLNVDGKLMSLFSTLTAFEGFQKNSSRLLRQLELKFSIEIQSSNKSDYLIKVINSFHTVAIQLCNRHKNRETLKIEDEYDVQDLLHGLLRVEFSDVRAEEHTPSYAGSSSRIDFLLKTENTVIEVKKTRDGLKDKEVGDQLIIDAQHYKAHPNCKRLICFVYDPENKIKNPRGLEADLNILTTDDLIVETFIRP
jgi:hypothetical protein